MANRNSRKIRILFIILVILAAGVVFSIATVYGMLSDDDYRSLFTTPHPSLTTQNTSAPVKSSAAAPSSIPETIEYNGTVYTRNENIVNILFLGIDYTAERADMNLGSRSDMVLVCAVDSQAKKASLISIPRDTYTTVKKLDASGKIKSETQNKINSAYSFGGGEEGNGARNTMDCVQMFLQRECLLKDKLPFTLNIPVYLYASIDIDGIAPVASAVGGVEITLDYDIPGVGSKGDTVLLEGEKAERFIRDRHNTPGGDLGRADKEQEFMKKLAEKVKDMGAVQAIVKLYSTLNKYVRTNLTINQIIDLAEVLSSVNVTSIETYTIPGKSGIKDGTSYYFQDEEETLKLLLNVYYTVHM